MRSSWRKGLRQRILMRLVRAEQKGMSREKRGRCIGQTVSLTAQGAYWDKVEVSLEDKVQQDRKRLDTAHGEV